MRMKLSGRMLGLLACLMLILPVLGACGGNSTASGKNSGPVWGFPFKSSTTVTLGSFGLHDDNFSSVPGTNGTYFFGGYDTVKDASLDLLPSGSSVPVIPLASGTVFATWPTCHVVVVDHGGGVLVEYLHINVNVRPGDPVTRDTTLGTTTTSVSTGPLCNEKSEGANGQPVEHVHFAFLSKTNATPPYTAANPVATFETMIGRVLCGYSIATSAPTGSAPEGGAIEGLANAPDQSFRVPNCPSSTGAVLGASTSAAVTPTPTLSQLSVYIGSRDGYTYSLNASDGTLRWKTQASSGISGTVVSGVLYTNEVDAFRASDGQLEWHFSINAQVSSSSVPAVSDGFVYTSGSGDGLVHALRANDGVEIWRFTTKSQPFSTPSVYGGVVYVGDTGGNVYALRANNGSLLWEYKTGSDVESAPTLVGDILYVGSEDRSVYALRADDGRLLWSYQTGTNSTGYGGVGGAPQVVGGTVYFSAQDGNIYALDAMTGGLLWRYRMEDASTSTVAVSNGVVYCSSHDRNVYAVRATDGTLLWRFQTGDLIDSVPTEANGIIVFGSSDHDVYAIHASDGSLLWRFQTGGAVETDAAIGPWVPS